MPQLNQPIIGSLVAAYKDVSYLITVDFAVDYYGVDIYQGATLINTNWHNVTEAQFISGEFYSLSLDTDYSLVITNYDNEGYDSNTNTYYFTTKIWSPQPPANIVFKQPEQSVYMDVTWDTGLDTNAMDVDVTINPAVGWGSVEYAGLQYVEDVRQIQMPDADFSDYATWAVRLRPSYSDGVDTVYGDWTTPVYLTIAPYIEDANADLFWVGTSGDNWGSNGWGTRYNWAYKAGGIPELYLEPTYLNNAFISLGADIGMQAESSSHEVYCKDLNISGSTGSYFYGGTFYGTSIRIAGNLNITGNPTLNANLIFYLCGSADQQVDTNSVLNPGQFIIDSTGDVYINDWNSNNLTAISGTIHILCNIVCPGGMLFSYYYSPQPIEVYFNGHTITTLSFSTITSAYATLHTEDSTIIIYCEEYVGGAGFGGGGHTYNNVEINLNGCTFEGANTFNDLKIKGGITLALPDYTTQTVTSLSSDATEGNLVTLLAYSIYQSPVIGQATISAASGNISVSYWDITNSEATGGATFRAINSIDSGGNTGWIFGTAGNVFVYDQSVSDWVAAEVYTYESGIGWVLNPTTIQTWNGSAWV